MKFFHDRASDIISGIIKFIVWIALTISNILDGSFNMLHIKLILDLPIIRNIVGFVRSIFQNGFQGIIMEIEQFFKFINSIINEHKDFFGPIFKTINDDVNAIVEALDTIARGNKDICKYTLCLSCCFRLEYRTQQICCLSYKAAFK